MSMKKSIIVAALIATLLLMPTAYVFARSNINSLTKSQEEENVQTVNLLGQAAFRRALAYAYDKTKVCTDVWGGWAMPIDVPVPAVMGAWSAENQGLLPGSYAAHDPESALAELEKLGIKDYDNDSWLEIDPDNPYSEITIQIMGTDTPTVRQIVGVLAESVEAIGIHVDQVFVDFNTLIDKLFSGDFELTFFGFGLGRLPYFLEAFASWSIYSILGGWSNATYDDLILKAFYTEDTLTNITKAYQYVWEAQKIFWYELPLIPIYQNIIVGVYDPNVWKGIISLPGSPVENWYTIMRIVKQVAGGGIDTNATLRLGLGYYADCLNPVASTTAYDWAILGMLFDSLTTPNPYDYFNISADLPWMLAEPPTFRVVEEENRTLGEWTLKLRDDIYFFDGQQLTADDVVFTYDLIKWIGDANDPWYDVYVMVVNATKVDDFTVKVYTYLEAADMPCIGLAARYALGIVVFPKHIYEREETWGIEDEDNYDVFPNWNVTPDDIMNYEAKGPDDPILTGYGPFRLKSWSPADASVSEATSFLLERNPTYFMRAIDENDNIIHPWKDWSEMNATNFELYGPYIKYLEFKVITEASALKDAVLSGEIDIAEELEFGKWVYEFQSAGFTIATSLRLGFGHTFINTRALTVIPQPPAPTFPIKIEYVVAGVAIVAVIIAVAIILKKRKPAE